MCDSIHSLGLPQHHSVLTNKYRNTLLRADHISRLHINLSVLREHISVPGVSEVLWLSPAFGLQPRKIFQTPGSTGAANAPLNLHINLARGKAQSRRKTIYLSRSASS
ncbi:hypothetical protein M3J09_003800 [Ascochyta lentis]